MGWAREHIRTQSNKLDRNKNVLTSNKENFKEDNRIGTFDHDQNNKLSFKKVSKFELKKIKDKIRLKFAKENKKEIIVFSIIGIVFLIVLLFVFKQFL